MGRAIDYRRPPLPRGSRVTAIFIAATRSAHAPRLDRNRVEAELSISLFMNLRQLSLNETDTSCRRRRDKAEAANKNSPLKDRFALDALKRLLQKRQEGKSEIDRKGLCEPLRS